MNYLYIVVDATLSLINTPDNIGLKSEKLSTQVKPHTDAASIAVNPVIQQPAHRPLLEYFYFKHALHCLVNTPSSDKDDGFPEERA